MEKEERSMARQVEREYFLQWGSRKRVRCVRVRGHNPPAQVSSSSTVRRRILSFTHKQPTSSPYTRSSSSEERCYRTRGSTVEENGKITVDGGAGGDEESLHHDHGSDKKMNWPKLCIGLSSKEKEEDFMAMKGSKLPQRPKKRAKLIQRTLLLVSPGAWLTDVSLERYQIRERKTRKKKSRGLKAMGSIESYSD